MFVHIAFWFFAAAAVYPYLVYPLLAYVMSKLRGRPLVGAPAKCPVSIVVAAFNEAACVSRRVSELSRLAKAYHNESEIIIVSDGSTDNTANRVRQLELDNVQLIEITRNQGKANAINCGVAAAKHPFVAFADVRQTWHDDALLHLLDPFRDPRVGAVSGDLVLQSSTALAGVGIYWRLEKWLRIQESRWHSGIGVTGAICAVRRALFRPLPRGIVLDDVCWPMDVVMQGYRVVHVPQAIAWDQLPDKLSDEYKRKVRTLAGNFQLISVRPTLLLPWRNPAWLQFVSHKVMRLTMPWFVLAAWFCGVLLIRETLYAALMTTGTCAFFIGLAAASTTLSKRVPILSVAATIFTLNYAAWMAFWVWATGGVSRSWKKIDYT